MVMMKTLMNKVGHVLNNSCDTHTHTRYKREHDENTHQKDNAIVVAPRAADHFGSHQQYFRVYISTSN